MLQVHPMIKTLGPFEDASDLASIQPVLQHWAEVVEHQESQVQYVNITDRGKLNVFWSVSNFISLRHVMELS